MENLFLPNKMNLNFSFPESYLRENLNQTDVIGFKNNIIDYHSRVARGVSPGNSFPQAISSLRTQITPTLQNFYQNIDKTLAGVVAGIGGLPDTNTLKIAGLAQAKVGEDAKKLAQDFETKLNQLTPLNLEQTRTDLRNFAGRARNVERDIQTRFNQTVAAVRQNLPATLDERLSSVVQSARLHSQEVGDLAKNVGETIQTISRTL